MFSLHYLLKVFEKETQINIFFCGDSREKQQKNLANGAAIEYNCMEGN